MASEWGYKNQNSSHRDKFRWNFDQGKGNLVRVSGSSSYGVSTVVLSTVTGSLSDDDGDGNKNGKKAIGLD